MQYTRPDLMYTVNRIYNHAYDPSTKALQGINHPIRYLTGCPQCPIMYPSSLNGTIIHEIRQEVFPGDFHSQNISNDLVVFVDEG